MWIWLWMWMVLLGVGEALVTLQTIRNLTDATDGYRGRIEELGSVGVSLGGSGGGQVVFGIGVGEKEVGGGGGDEGEIEDVSSFLSWLLNCLGFSLGLFFYFLGIHLFGVRRGEGS